MAKDQSSSSRADAGNDAPLRAIRQAYEFGREDERKGTREQRPKLRLIRGRLTSIAATAGIAGVACAGLLSLDVDPTSQGPPAHYTASASF